MRACPLTCSRVSVVLQCLLSYTRRLPCLSGCSVLMALAVAGRLPCHCTLLQLYASPSYASCALPSAAPAGRPLPKVQTPGRKMLRSGSAALQRLTQMVGRSRQIYKVRRLCFPGHVFSFIEGGVVAGSGAPDLQCMACQLCPSVAVALLPRNVLPRQLLHHGPKAPACLLLHSTGRQP